MRSVSKRQMWRVAFALSVAASTPVSAAHAQTPPAAAARPWMDARLSPDERARLAVAAMTSEEKLAILSGSMPKVYKGEWPADMIDAAGYVPGVPRLGIPALRESDAGLGVANLHNREGDVATGLPSGLATAASWDAATAFAGGAVIGGEARAKGFNVLLAGGVNLVREPRGGRSFEYAGEDPLLAGVMAGEAIRGVQSANVVSTIKHFALNAQEAGRHVLDARIGEAALRESDLLAFQIAIERGRPGSVMCAYNVVNGGRACENRFLLSQVLKRDWGYPGWVMSDWGAVYSTAASANAGLDQESGHELDRRHFFGPPLAAAVRSGEVPQGRIDDMARRVLRSMFAAGVVDRPALGGEPIDYARNGEVSRTAAERGMVLLKNDRGALPLSPRVRRIAVIGGRPDGVLMGGGSSQVTGPGGHADEARARIGGRKIDWGSTAYHRSSIVDAIRAQAPGAEIAFYHGFEPGRAALVAEAADQVVFVAEQWTTEAVDVPDLKLPDNQDAAIAAVAKTGKPVTVVLVTGGPVLMPWLADVRAVVQAWYPGSRGGEAIARVLFGAAEPSGRLPVTFPASEAQLPRPALDGAAANADPSLGAGAFKPFPVEYREGADVGYRWFERTGAEPLFPFGWGLGYTDFALSGLTIAAGPTPSVSFTVRNAGRRRGAEVAQVYARPPLPGAMRRLVGWSRVELEPGETRRVVVALEPRLLATYDVGRRGWRVPAGAAAIEVGRHAGDARLTGRLRLSEALLRP